MMRTFTKVVSGAVPLCVGVVAVTAALFATGAIHLSDFGIGAPQLPSYGRPANATKLEEDTLGCSSAVSASWCRNLMFGSQATFVEVRGQLSAAYEDHGWQVKSGPKGHELVVADKDGSTCVTYQDIKPTLGSGRANLSQELREWAAEYEVLIWVWLLPCSSAAPSVG